MNNRKGDKDKKISTSYLREYGLQVVQPVNGYRFSVDALLLAEFSTIKKRARVAELGSGTGVISLILAKKFPHATFVGMEIQKELYVLSKQNVTINGLENIEMVQMDIKEVRKYFDPGRFDSVVTNPPFRAPESGRLCINSQEALCRHEILITLQEILDAARYLLRPGGRFSLIYPAERLSFLLCSMTKAKIEPKRLKCVHPRPKTRARLVLVEGIKDGRMEMKIEEPVFLNL